MAARPLGATSRLMPMFPTRIGSAGFLFAPHYKGKANQRNAATEEWFCTNAFAFGITVSRQDAQRELNQFECARPQNGEESKNER